MRLKGKVAIITGGARGLGKSYCLRFLEEGAKVVVADILEANWIKQAIDEKGSEALALYTDVTDEESTKKMVFKTIEHFGRIDILINNAAPNIRAERKPFHEISVQAWDKMIQVILRGTFLCCKAVYPQMKKQGKGKIINVSSGAFFTGGAYYIHYISSKGGIVGFTRALARELGDDGICVNAIAPGFTVTDVIKEKPVFDEEMVRAIVRNRCLKREAIPDDLAGTVVFLASGDSDFITGQTIIVDGGSVLH